MNTGLVVVSVTVVTEVLMLVVVDGVGVSVVVGADEVVGATVVVGGGGGGGATLDVEGCAVLCSVGTGREAEDVTGADDDEGAVTLLEVAPGLGVLPELVNFTTA